MIELTWSCKERGWHVASFGGEFIHAVHQRGWGWDAFRYDHPSILTEHASNQIASGYRTLAECKDAANEWANKQ